tara:strand:+ start:2085 stop:3233 length:1149 start_codon:yes stop_codon:yes gene_type:complete
MIPYSRQFIDDNDIKSVVKVLKSDFLTQGEFVNKFEEAFKKKYNVREAISVNSATSGLILACKSLGLSKNDYFWATPNTYVASINCGLHCGAKLDFVDINLNNLNISVNDLEKKLKLAKKNNKLPKVLVITDFAGLPSCSVKIYNLSKIYKFKIIQDASHSLGAKYLNSYVGDCKYSHITVFSFHPVKIITTGEGGMITTNNKKIGSFLKVLRSGGITKSLSKNKIYSEGSWFYEQIALGYNFRLTDIQAALGLSQLKKLDNFVKKRRKISNIYQSKLSQFPVSFQSEDVGYMSSYHLFVIKVDHKIRKKLFNFLRSKKINVNVHYIPTNIHPFIKKLGFKKNDFPNALNYYKSAISIPIYPSLKKKQIDYVIEVLKNFFTK